MEVILLKNVENLGSLGDKVSVKGGYGRNFLIPTGSAVPATAANQAAFEERRAELEKEAAEAVSQAETRKTAIEALSIVIPVKSGEEGRLFGSVGAADIADAASAAGAAARNRPSTSSAGAAVNGLQNLFMFSSSRKSVFSLPHSGELQLRGDPKISHRGILAST